MGSTLKVGIGSTIIEKDGKYTFVIHPTTAAAEGLPVISAADADVWFSSIEEAKAAGVQDAPLHHGRDEREGGGGPPHRRHPPHQLPGVPKLREGPEGLPSDGDDSGGQE